MKNSFGMAARLLAFAAVLWGPSTLSAQEHAHHGGTARQPDPRTRLMFESPQLALAHYGYLELTTEQMQRLRRVEQTLCTAQARRDSQLETASQHFIHAVHGDHLDEAQALAVFKQIGENDSQWLLAMLRARQDTYAALSPEQRVQFAGLVDHWLREYGFMIADHLRPTHVGHGSGPSVRVPGMTLYDMTVTPYCISLHGLRMMVSPGH